MQYTSARFGRVFVIRLEDGDVLHECVENLAREEGITHGVCFFLGGADGTSRLVVGPEDGHAARIVPMTLSLGDVHEAAAVGTLIPDDSGNGVLHMHGVFGRKDQTRAGCVRAGVDVWLVGEVVLMELTECTARRLRDPDTGFQLLEAGSGDGQPDGNR